MITKPSADVETASRTARQAMFEAVDAAFDALQASSKGESGNASRKVVAVLQATLEALTAAKAAVEACVAAPQPALQYNRPVVASAVDDAHRAARALCAASLNMAGLSVQSKSLVIATSQVVKMSTVESPNLEVVKAYLEMVLELAKWVVDQATQATAQVPADDA